MRSAGWFVVFLVAGIWGASLLPAPQTPSPAGGGMHWRYTSAGWERVERVLAPPAPHRPRLHPAVLAAAQLLASLMALVAAEPPRPRAVDLQAPWALRSNPKASSTTDQAANESTPTTSPGHATG